MPTTTLNSNSDLQQSELKPFLKWLGGKSFLVPTLLPIWNNHLIDHPAGRLVEPFCGSLAVALGLNPKRALLNDTNRHLINLYRQIQKGLPPLKTQREQFRNIEFDYYRNRSEFNRLRESSSLADKQRRAQLFYYFNRVGYRGVCRFNATGDFNVPYGHYRTVEYLPSFDVYKNRFEFWKFTSGDFEGLSAKLAPGDMLYCDPPYDGSFSDYVSGGFNWTDQKRLIEWIVGTKRIAVISNLATPRILRLYSQPEYGLKLRFVSAPRMISCDGNRQPVKEVLALYVP